jgi:predicted NUDIX family phosphoesterase
MPPTIPKAAPRPVERVAAVPRAHAEALGLLPHGFLALPSPAVLDTLCASLRFLERPAAEDDPSHKQLIPYGVVTRGTDVFLLERLLGGGEARLHGKLSIGVGGHINPPDLEPRSAAAPSAAILHLGMHRELTEELVIRGPFDATPVGLINDDTTPVGRVHLGVVYRIVLAAAGSAEVRETETLRGRFVPWSEVAAQRARLETWSAFALAAFESGAFA